MIRYKIFFLRLSPTVFPPLKPYPEIVFKSILQFCHRKRVPFNAIFSFGNTRKSYLENDVFDKKFKLDLKKLQVHCRSDATKFWTQSFHTQILDQSRQYLCQNLLQAYRQWCDGFSSPKIALCHSFKRVTLIALFPKVCCIFRIVSIWISPSF